MHLHTYICVSMHALTYTYIHTYVYPCMHIHTYIHLCIHACTDIHTFVYPCMHLHTYICVTMHAQRMSVFSNRQLQQAVATGSCNRQLQQAVVAEYAHTLGIPVMRVLSHLKTQRTIPGDMASQQRLTAAATWLLACKTRQITGNTLFRRSHKNSRRH